jgi:hypothetical protein
MARGGHLQKDKPMWKWLGNNSPHFQSVGAIATTIGAPSAAFALFLTWWQVGEARRAIEATTVYNLQKDAREMIVKLEEEPEVYDYLMAYDPQKKYPDEIVRKAQRKLHVVFQFYSSVFNQHQQGTLPENFWATFSEEICRFLQRDPVKQFWHEKVRPGTFNKAFKDFGDHCLEVSEPKGEKS